MIAVARKNLFAPVNYISCTLPGVDGALLNKLTAPHAAKYVCVKPRCK